MKLQIPILLVSAILFSCNSNRNSETTTDSTTSTIAVDSLETRKTDTIISKVEVNKTPKLFKGLYTYGHEVSTFRECGNSKVYWLNDSLSSMQKSYEKSTEFLSYPYESVYAEVEGYLAGKSNMGYASEYE